MSSKSNAPKRKPKKEAEPKKQPLTIGQQLKAARLEAGYTLKDIEVGTRIRGKYLVAIEADDHEALPHNVYTRGFVQSYAQFIGLPPTQTVNRYLKERGQKPVQLSRPRQSIYSRITISSRWLTVGLLALIAAAIVGYLIWQFSALAAAPDLEIKNPDKDQVVYGSLINVSGQVSGGADVFVNDSPILSDAGGNFSDSIALQDGVNAIRVSATNKLGKTTVVTRNILAHVPKIDTSNTLPGAPFDGVAVRVQIKDQTAAVTVRADGKEVFKGTILPGAVQVFKAGQKITISTSNGGATLLAITNSVVAGHDLGPAGKLGQPRANLEFSKDTQFQ